MTGSPTSAEQDVHSCSCTSHSMSTPSSRTVGELMKPSALSASPRRSRRCRGLGRRALHPGVQAWSASGPCGWSASGRRRAAARRVRQRRVDARCRCPAGVAGVLVEDQYLQDDLGRSNRVIHRGLLVSIGHGGGRAWTAMDAGTGCGQVELRRLRPSGHACVLTGDAVEDEEERGPTQGCCGRADAEQCRCYTEAAGTPWATCSASCSPPTRPHAPPPRPRTAADGHHTERARPSPQPAGLVDDTRARG